MRTADNDLIEQIVANVLAELQPTSTVRAPAEPPAVTPNVKSEPPVVEFDNPVITADLLAGRVRSGQSARFARRSVLTPSARDWLAQRKVTWTRVAGAGAANVAAARWQLVITTVTPAVSTLRPTLVGWKSELLGTAREAADHAIRGICTGETDGMLCLCGAAETVACLANRNDKLRAAVVSSVADLPGLVDQLGPNLLVANPKGKSFVELRNLVRAVESLTRPQVPEGL